MLYLAIVLNQILLKMKNPTAPSNLIVFQIKKLTVMILSFYFLLCNGNMYSQNSADSIARWKSPITIPEFDPNFKKPEIILPIPPQPITPRPTPTNTQDKTIVDVSNIIQSENSVFVSPSNHNVVVNANNSSQWDGSMATGGGVGVFVSRNGGQTWTSTTSIPNSYSDPACVIDLTGRIYVNYIGYGFDAANDSAIVKGQNIAFSDDFGITWSYSVIGLSHRLGFLADKNHLWVDNSSTSLYKGRLYCAWMDYNYDSLGPLNPTGHQHIMFTSSSDKGLTWLPHYNITLNFNTGYSNQGVNIQTGPNGEIYLCWAIYDDLPYCVNIPPKDPVCFLPDENAIGFAAHFIGGKLPPIMPNGAGMNWIVKRAINNIKGIRSGISTFRVNSFPVMAVNQNNGNIYIVWTNQGVPGNNNGDADIYFIRSTDRGNTWGTPVRVNQDPINNQKKQFFPWITFDKFSGYIAVIFYDHRNNVTNAGKWETYVAISKDEGNTWEDFPVSDASFDLQPIPGILGNYAGDYIGISMSNFKVYPVWSDARTGRMLAYTSPFILGHRTPGKTSSFATDTFLLENAASIEDSSFSGFNLNNNFFIFSNPAKDNVNIVFNISSESIISMSIYNILGSKILYTMNEEKHLAGTIKKQIDVENNFNAGIYICKAIINEQTFIKKFVIIN